MRSFVLQSLLLSVCVVWCVVCGVCVYVCVCSGSSSSGNNDVYGLSS